MQATAVTLLLLSLATSSLSLGIDGVRSLEASSASSLFSSQSACDASGGICSELLCSTSRINVTLNRLRLADHSIDSLMVYLRDRRCIGFPYDVNNVYVSWPLGNGVCGTDLTVNNTHAIYRNQIFMPPDPTAIIYREILILNVSCVYPRNLNTSGPGPIWPDPSVLYIPIENAGNFRVKMAIYQDISYTTPYTSFPVVLQTTQNLYVGLYLANDDDTPSNNLDFKLLMVNCFSTPTDNFYDSVRYDIITNQCPNPRDSTIRILENGISSQGKFYIQAFKFIGDYSYVYLHCEVYLCRGPCPPTCNSRSGGAELKPQGRLTIGPIRRSDLKTSVADSVGKATGWSAVTILGLVMANMLFL